MIMTNMIQMQTYLSILAILQVSVYVDRNKCKHFDIITAFFNFENFASKELQYLKAIH